MNNIDNVVSVINKNGGTATEEEILCAYVNMWHILPILENKQKIKSTLIAHDGKEVFYNKEKIHGQQHHNLYIQFRQRKPDIEFQAKKIPVIGEQSIKWQK